MADRSRIENPIRGQRIRDERLRIGLTQSALGAKIGKTDSAVRLWEIGVSEPDNETIIKLATIFGVSTDYLLGVVDNRPLNIPDSLQGVSVAFHGGLDGLTQDDINDVANFVEFLRNKKTNK